MPVLHPKGRMRDAVVIPKYTTGKCSVCGKSFNKFWPSAKRCKFCIKLGRRSVKKSAVTGSYVYGWYYSGAILPFYIGKGKELRGWRKSNAATIRIYRDNLTDEGAKLVEAVLIDLFKSMGATLTNKVSGMNRQEVLPIEIEKK